MPLASTAFLRQCSRHLPVWEERSYADMDDSMDQCLAMCMFDFTGCGVVRLTTDKAWVDLESKKKTH